MHTGKPLTLLRIDLLLDPRRAEDFTEAFDLIRARGGTTFRVGRHPGQAIDGKPVCYLAVGGVEPHSIASRLAHAGYEVVGVEPWNRA